MKEDNALIEQRLESMKKTYTKIGEFIDNLPEGIPEKTKNTLKDTILGDKELKRLMEGIEVHRPPRVFLIGRTGVGKSSLVNALCGAYVAKVSDTKSCTPSANICQCKSGNRTLMEILDTRGIAESDTLNDDMPAEKMLMEQINEFSPDIAIMMLNCTHRDDILEDVEFMKRVADNYAQVNNLRLPIVVVVNKCDQMAPARQLNPEAYPQSKIEKINEVVQYYKGIIMKGGLKIDNIIPVSSLVDWQTPDGMEVTAEDIEKLPQHDIDNLEFAFDGRYRIEELLDILEEAIQDFEAQMGLRMASRLSDVVKRIAKQLNKIFSGLSATIALTPIPTSDLYILIALQSILVCLIASLSGREISIQTAKEFLFSISGIGGLGFSLKLMAQQGAKFANAVWPGAGSAVSASFAGAGTSAVGNAAIAYYIDGKSLPVAKEKLDFLVRKKQSE